MFEFPVHRIQFPFKAQRELARNGLILPAVFGAITALIRQNRKNSLFYGKNREPGCGSFERMMALEAANIRPQRGRPMCWRRICAGAMPRIWRTSSLPHVHAGIDVGEAAAIGVDRACVDNFLH